MEDLNQRSQQDLPGLRRWVNDLLALANKMVENVQHSEDDHFGFMALCFLSKQMDHTRSILALNESRDVVLIARSMIEGMCQLLWAAKDPDNRALQWRTFAWVHDWRIMQAQIAAGKPVDPARRATIEEALRQYGDQFLKPKAREARGRGDLLPGDHYYKNWTKHHARQICECVGGEVLYLKLYKPFSDWIHWSPGGLGAAIARQQNRVVYSSVSLANSATALATGFQCLLQTVEVVDQHLEMGMTRKIADLRDGYIAWHEAHHNLGTRNGS